jgi:hypothetical protein
VGSVFAGLVMGRERVDGVSYRMWIGLGRIGLKQSQIGGFELSRCISVSRS